MKRIFLLIFIITTQFFLSTACKTNNEIDENLIQIDSLENKSSQETTTIENTKIFEDEQFSKTTNDLFEPSVNATLPNDINIEISNNLDPNNPAATVSEKEIGKRFDEILDVTEKYYSFIMLGGAKMIPDKNGDVQLIEKQSENQTLLYFKIEETYSINKIREDYAKYFSEPRLNKIYEDIDYFLMYEDENLYFLSFDQVLGRFSREPLYLTDKIVITKRENNRVEFMMEIFTQYNQQDVNKFTFVYEDNVWKISEGNIC